MAAVAAPHTDFSPGLAAYAYAAAGRAAPASRSSNNSNNKTNRILRRVSRNMSPFSSTGTTPSLSCSPVSVSSPRSAPPTPYAAPYSPPTDFVVPTKIADRPRRLRRKPVPGSSTTSEQQEKENVEVEAAQTSGTKRERRPSSPAESDDCLWTSTTCNDMPSPPSSPDLSASRRSSETPSSILAAAGEAELAILLSTVRRRSSIPSPAALAANASLSPRLARIAAFANTVSSKDRFGSIDSSFDLPELELPWLPTLFPMGTPHLEVDGDGFSPIAQTLATFPSPPSSTSTSTGGTLSASSSLSYPSSSSSASSSDSHSDAHSVLTASTFPTTAPHSPTSSHLSFSSAFPPTASSSSRHRKNLFRVVGANGEHVVIDTTVSTSKTPRLPSLDFSSVTPSSDAGGLERFHTPQSTPMGEFDRQLGHGLGMSTGEETSTSWVEVDEADGGEVLVIALSPRLS